MKRTFTKFVIFSVAILSAELLVQYLTTLIPNVESPGSPYYSALLRMGLIITIFYPCFLIFEGVMESVARSYVKNTKKLTTGWWRGMIIGFTLAILLLLWGYAFVWYQRNLVMDVWDWIIGFF